MKKFEIGIKIVDKTMQELGIKYAFISGTALGLGREGRCLDYDTDVDFSIHTDNRKKINDIVLALSSNGLNKISQVYFGKRIETIGFEIVDGNNDWVELDLLHSRNDIVWHSAFVGTIPNQPSWITKVYPKEMWEKLEFIDAYGIKCPVFSPINKYLEMCYGDDWKTPRPKFWYENYFPETEARNYNWDLSED